MGFDYFLPLLVGANKFDGDLLLIPASFLWTDFFSHRTNVGNTLSQRHLKTFDVQSAPHKVAHPIKIRPD